MRVDLGLLILRVLSASLMFFGHGLGKLQNFSTLSLTFPDPMGVGSAGSLALAIFAEVFCSVLLFIGLATRLACVPLLTTMFVAVLVIHAGDPWSRKEMALLYAVPFLTLMFTGPGMFSIDALIQSRPKMFRP